METKTSVDEGMDLLEVSFRELVLSMAGKIYPVEMAQIRPKESLRLKCVVPLCEYYGICKVCPPNIPGVAEFRRALGQYTRAFLVVYREKIYDLDTYRKDFAAELKLHEMVSSLEKLAFEMGHYQAIGLVVGGCKLCERCTPHGEPCRHPYKARPSPEGFGVDINALARFAKVQLEWPPKEYVTFMGLVLL